jgi:hypothetical protein
MDEFAAAVGQSFQRADVYILPVVVGDVSVPPELLNPAVGFLRADDHTPAQLADKVAAKIDRIQSPLAPPTAGSFRALQVAPKAFDLRKTLELALGTIGTRFQQSAASALEPYGFTCQIIRDAVGVDVRIEHEGGPVCGLSLWFDGNLISDGLDRLAMSFAWPTNDRQSMNGWVSAAWNPDDPSAVLKFTDFSLVGSEQVLTVDQFVAALWDKIANHTEQRVRWVAGIKPGEWPAYSGRAMLRPRQPSVSEFEVLEGALYEVPLLRDRENRTDIIWRVERQLGNGISVSRSPIDRIDLRRLVERCFDFASGPKALTDVLRASEGDSLPFLVAADLLANIAARCGYARDGEQRSP